MYNLGGLMRRKWSLAPWVAHEFLVKGCMPPAK